MGHFGPHQLPLARDWVYADVRATLTSSLQDLESLPGGDLAEIGERGINLSGGQKMRVAIARAVYADCDTIILDDPLAAVDSHVAAALFYKLFVEKLKDKAVLLITNQVQYLRDTAKVVVMDNGKIAEQGTYEELVAKKGKFAELVASTEGEVGDGGGDDSDGDDGAAADGGGDDDAGSGTALKEIELDLTAESDDKKNKAGKLNAKETIVVGTTPWSVYKQFFRAGGNGNYSTAIFAFVVYFISGIAEVAADAWLAVWSNQGAYNTTDVNDKQWMNLGQ